MQGTLLDSPHPLEVWGRGRQVEPLKACGYVRCFGASCSDIASDGGLSMTAALGLESVFKLWRAGEARYYERYHFQGYRVSRMHGM